MVAAVPKKAAWRVREGLRLLLVEKGWIDKDCGTGDLEEVEVEGRPAEQVELIRAWVRAATAVDHSRLNPSTMGERFLKEAVEELEAAERHIATARRAIVRHEMCSPDFMKIEGIGQNDAKIRQVAELGRRASKLVQEFRGVRRIADADDFDAFITELTVLLPRYGLTQPDIAELVFNSRSKEAVRKVASRRHRALKKSRKKSR